MNRIEIMRVVKIHDTEHRDRRKCTNCGRRRSTTRVTLSSTTSQKTVDIFECNDCLTETPNWR